MEKDIIPLAHTIYAQLSHRSDSYPTQHEYTELKDLIERGEQTLAMWNVQIAQADAAGDLLDFLYLSSRHSVLKKQIESYANIVARIRKVPTESYTDIAAPIRKVPTESYTDIVAPIRKIPTEIWTEILLLAVKAKVARTELCLDTMMAIYETCWCWKQILLDSKSLWSIQVDLRKDSHNITRRLSLIEVALSRTPKGTLPRLSIITTGRISEVEDFFISHYDKLVSLDLTCPIDTLPLFFSRSSFPLLEELRLHIDPRSHRHPGGRHRIDELSIPVFDEPSLNAPNLRRVTLIASDDNNPFNMRKLHLPWSQLLYLKISGLRLSDAGYRVFGLCQNLEECSFTFQPWPGWIYLSDEEEHDEQPDAGAIQPTLPRLKKLKIVSILDQQMEVFFRRVRLPSLTELRIGNTRYGNWLRPEIVAEFPTFVCLQRLAITKYSMPPTRNGLLALIELAPSFKELDTSKLDNPTP